MKRPSLKLRITGWFALMMFVIEALVLAFLLAVNGTVATNDPEARLVRMVEHNANRVKYNNRQFRFSRIHYNRSGVYTVLYDADGNVLQGTFPAEFTPAQPLPLGSETVRLVDCGDNEYYVYDVRVDMMVGSVWLRGVIDADANGGVMRVILPLAWSLLPVLLVLSVIGGYFIASRARPRPMPSPTGRTSRRASVCRTRAAATRSISSRHRLTICSTDSSARSRLNSASRPMPRTS